MAEGELADEKRQRTRKRRKNEEKRQREDDLRAVMSTPSGRRFVWWLLNSEAGITNGSFSINPVEMAYFEGRRSVGRTVMQEVQRVAVGDYLRMMQEQMEAQQQAALTKQAEDADPPDAV